jgi:hypothetical protein
MPEVVTSTQITHILTNCDMIFIFLIKCLLLLSSVFRTSARQDKLISKTSEESPFVQTKQLRTRRLDSNHSSIDPGDGSSRTTMRRHYEHRRRSLQFHADKLRDGAYVAGVSGGSRSIPVVSVQSTMSPGRKLFWEKAWPSFDSTKKEKSMWNTTLSGGRPTLSRYHILVIPTYWDGEKADNNYVKKNIEDSMKNTADFYKNMSWGKNTVTWEILDRVILKGVTKKNADFDNSEQATRSIVKKKGYVEFVDYTGILMLYNLADQGPFANGGGWAGVNCKYSKHQSWITRARLTNR